MSELRQLQWESTRIRKDVEDIKKFLNVTNDEKKEKEEIV